ncbi:MAG TPA: hypothetical protein VGY54_14925, partial [Polyangiaceae bacterium]|nr:hypothetical protein [Polyangiaceae bacterium]
MGTQVQITNGDADHRRHTYVFGATESAAKHDGNGVEYLEARGDPEQRSCHAGDGGDLRKRGHNRLAGKGENYAARRHERNRDCERSRDHAVGVSHRSA